MPLTPGRFLPPDCPPSMLSSVHEPHNHKVRDSPRCASVVSISATSLPSLKSYRSKTVEPVSSGTPRSIARYSAPTRAQLREFTNSMGQTGRFCVEKEYISSTRNSLVAHTTLARMRHLAREEFMAFLTHFRRQDRAGNGKINKDEFMIIMEKMKTGVSQRQMELFCTSVLDTDGTLDYEAFLEEFSQTNEGRVAEHERRSGRHSSSARGKRKHLLVPKTSITAGAQPTLAAGTEMPLMTCLLGFLCFPLWCCGFRWLNDTDRRRRFYGRASIALLCCLFVILCGAGFGLVLMLSSAAGAPVGNTAHCSPMTMVLVSLKLAGEHASVSYFQDYFAQLQFRRR